MNTFFSFSVPNAVIYESFSSRPDVQAFREIRGKFTSENERKSIEGSFCWTSNASMRKELKFYDSISIGMLLCVSDKHSLAFEVMFKKFGRNLRNSILLRLWNSIFWFDV